jgi:hypothetical protein
MVRERARSCEFSYDVLLFSSAPRFVVVFEERKISRILTAPANRSTTYQSSDSSAAAADAGVDAQSAQDLTIYVQNLLTQMVRHVLLCAYANASPH